MQQRGFITRIVYLAAAGLLCAQFWSADGQNVGARDSQSPVPPVCLSVLVPSYMSPSAGGLAWNTIIADPVRSNDVERILIVNPNSGPATAANSEYRSVVTAAQRAGNQVYGYVSTRYGKVDPQIVQEEIRKYIKWYGVDGIFVDEVSADAAQVVQYYQPVATFITSAINGGGVILNSGTYPDPRYAEIKVPKHSKLQIVVFEHDFAAFTAASFVVPAWSSKYPASMFINIVYDAPAKGLAKVLQLSAQRGVGSVYVTDQSLPNPYAALPSYWAELNQATQADCVR
jgi:hypothetical protein